MVLPLQRGLPRRRGKFPDGFERSADDHKDALADNETASLTQKNRQSSFFVSSDRQSSKENVDYDLDPAHTALYRGSDYGVVRGTRCPQFCTRCGAAAIPTAHNPVELQTIRLDIGRQSKAAPRDRLTRPLSCSATTLVTASSAPSFIMFIGLRRSPAPVVTASLLECKILGAIL